MLQVISLVPNLLFGCIGKALGSQSSYAGSNPVSLHKLWGTNPVKSIKPKKENPTFQLANDLNFDFNPKLEVDNG